VKPGKKPKKPAATPAPSGGQAWRRVVTVLLVFGVVAGLVWGIAQIGDVARRGIGPRDRYAVRFADLECEAPPGLDRAAFLSEVRYVSNFPEHFQSLDPELGAKLGAAFTAHPWVAACESVSVDTAGTVRVTLTFRIPTLVVATTDDVTRVVDSAGVLLPVGTVGDGLPELATPVPVPPTSAGQVWTDATVARARELADAHHPRRLEKTPRGWRLTMPDGRVLMLER